VALGVVRAGNTRALLVVIFAVQLLIMMMWGTLAVFASAEFGFGGPQMGYVSAFAATVGIASQIGVLRIATRVASDRAILVGALLSMCCGLLAIGASTAPALLLVGVGLIAASFNTAMPTAMGFVSRLVSEDEQGSAMGTTSSAISAASVLGPVAAGALFSVSARGSYALAAAIALGAALLALRGVKAAR
jgi:MFS transporter, DHA1 family, tetracycline resistance protein